MEALTSPRVLKQLIEKHGFKFSKGLGQNFLIDENILQKIIEGARIQPHDRILEIGPGVGTLTQALAGKAGHVTAVEIDRRLLPILQETLAQHTNVTVVHGDIMKLKLDVFVQTYFDGQPFKVVANLPYYITTPILMRFLEEDLPFESIVVMIQKEVAERIIAGPGTGNYGALSVAVQYYTIPRMIAKVPSSVFLPPPKVDSMVMALDKRDQPPVAVRDKSTFFKVVKASFAQRRKTLVNALSSENSLGKTKQEWWELLKMCGIDPARRGETLNMDEFGEISNRCIEN